MYKYFLLFALCFLLTGCGFHREMRYTAGFGEYVDKKFAKKLANCEPYTSPAYYYGTGIFQIRKHTIRIKGYSKNKCEVLVNDKGVFSQNDGEQERLFIPKRFTKEMSEILLLAFKEHQYEERQAVEKALNLCREHNISGCLIYYSVNKKPVLHHYLTEIADFFKDYDPEKESLYW